MPHYEQARVELAKVNVAEERSFLDALRRVTVVAAATLSVGRVSVWRFIDEDRAIRCHFLHQPGHSDVSDGAILHRPDFPAYFQALEEHRVVRVNDLAADPLAAEFHDAYLRPLGITAMLDAPVYQGGRITAVVCHEQLDTPRTWTSQEAEFAAAVADALARLYGEATLAGARDSLGAYRRQLEQLRHLGAIGRLAAGMAHDFGNVLLATGGGAELIETTDGVDPEIREIAASIRSASERGRALVESLLRLARPGGTRPAVVDVGAVLRQAEAVLRISAGRSVALRLETPAGVPRVLIDPTELERAVVNLVLNARDAMPEGGTVLCRTFESPSRRADEMASFVVVEVRDEGHGMDERTMGRIFEPFFTTKGDKGTGLGLSIVQQTVVLAGGFVEAESVPGKGTTIRLHLPAIGTPVA